MLPPLGKILLSLAILGSLHQEVRGAEVFLQIEKQSVAVREHPRLLLTPAIEDRLGRLEPGSPSAHMWGMVLAAAEQAVQQPGPERVMEGRRLLTVSRTYLQRLSCVALAWRLTRRPEFLATVVADLQRVAGFSDWNPSHFLDVGEMTAAVALAYDWTWEGLTPEVRQVAIDAIQRHGLSKFLAAPPYWAKNRNNWNPVCHGGLVLGALAIAETDPAASSTVITRALRDVPQALLAYGPDGAYEEGPLYWDYGTSFLLLLAEGITSATGYAHGLDQAPGLLASGTYIAQVRGPSGGLFNYGDGVETAPSFMAQAWFARRLQAPWMAPDLTKVPARERLLAAGLLWSLDSPAPGGEPPAQYLAGGDTPVAILRGPGSYLAVKGGSPMANHGHQDVGSFIYETDAIRWSVDLGKEDYFKLEKEGLGIWKMDQDSDRWKVFRMSAASHAIPQIAGVDPVVTASAALTAQDLGGSSPTIRLDLTNLYAGAASNVVRTLEFRERRALRITDVYTKLNGPAAVRWQMVTRAKVTTTPAGLSLEQDGKTLLLSGVSALPGRWLVEDISRPRKPYERANPQCSLVAWEVTPTSGEDLQMQVDVVPVDRP